MQLEHEAVWVSGAEHELIPQFSAPAPPPAAPALGREGTARAAEAELALLDGLGAANPHLSQVGFSPHGGDTQNSKIKILS